ncbi:hypothetical protein DPMN_047131 [Dreissena polymorpha]|uniref:Uncharacterized protein n=1 Tax=Dreissena polymorpha TaxID=45954 RepID=A0A9D4HYU9_DREPO|nr:hypothetical protein DPMN_047131 [Dreissena polymorpha]
MPMWSPVECRQSPGKSALCRDATAIHRGFAGAYRRLPGLNRCLVVSLPMSDAGIAPVSAGGVTGSIGALPATTGALYGALSG